MYCNNCGTQIPDGTKFCQNCGALVTSAVTNDSKQIPANMQTNIKRKGKNSRKGKGCALAIILVIVLAVAAFIIFAVISPSDTEPSDDSSSSYISRETNASNISIADNEYFSAYFVKAESIYGLENSFNIYLNIENKSDVEEVFRLDDVYIDDTAANFSGSGVPQTVLPGKKMNGVFCIFYQGKIEDAEKLEFKIECMDSGFNDVKVTNNIVISLK